MKKTVAKIFCFLTVLLLSSNVLVAFEHYQYHQAESKSHVISRLSVEDQFNKLITSDSQISFLAENDSFEDFELLADILLSYSFEFKDFLFKNSAIREFKTNDFSVWKIPRWLWVRHIII